MKFSISKLNSTNNFGFGSHSNKSLVAFEWNWIFQCEVTFKQDSIQTISRLGFRFFSRKSTNCFISYINCFIRSVTILEAFSSFDLLLSLFTFREGNRRYVKWRYDIKGTDFVKQAYFLSCGSIYSEIKPFVRTPHLGFRSNDLGAVIYRLLFLWYFTFKIWKAKCENCLKTSN